MVFWDFFWVVLVPVGPLGSSLGPSLGRFLRSLFPVSDVGVYVPGVSRVP